MNTKKWLAASAVIGTIATVAVVAAFTNPVRVFRTTSLFIGVQQKANTIHPQYEYTLSDGSNLVALALGANPTSNQVFAMSIDCGSSVASLIAYDKSDSNIVTIATCSNLQIVQNYGPKAGFVNSERFVGEFAVQSTNNIAGGTLMVAGRLDLDSSGCPKAVVLKLDKDTDDRAFGMLADRAFGDYDVPDTDQDGKVKDEDRAGHGHMVGWLNLVDGDGGATNTVLVPFGHLTFRHQLDSFDAP